MYSLHTDTKLISTTINNYEQRIGAYVTIREGRIGTIRTNKNCTRNHYKLDLVRKIPTIKFQYMIIIKSI